MSGKVVTQTTVDTVRIEVLGESRAKNIPAAMIVDLDDLLRALLNESQEGLLVAHDDELGEWCAVWGELIGTGATPWGALTDLANRWRAEK